MAGQPFSQTYLAEVAAIASAISSDTIERLAAALSEIQNAGGRLFVLGVGGSAANASHAVADFRRLTALRAYTPVDNVAELTARINDDGWDQSLAGWLERSEIDPRDAILIFSVGGGSRRSGISVNLVRAAEAAHQRGAAVFVIAGRDDGDATELADLAVVVPAPPERLTPHAESFQAVVWHLLASHPLLAAARPLWEGMSASARRPAQTDG
jgi:D-sedoheptulose 7-phosphate isomerase